MLGEALARHSVTTTDFNADGPEHADPPLHWLLCDRQHELVDKGQRNLVLLIVEGPRSRTHTHQADMAYPVGIPL